MAALIEFNYKDSTIKELRDLVQAQKLEIFQLKETIQQLRNEVAVLKKINPKPKIEPSRLEKNKDKKNDDKESSEKRPGSDKQNKTANLKIHVIKTIRPDKLPPEAVFKGYRGYTIQDILITPHNTHYRLERWETPDGNPIEGQLPPEVRGHFGNTLKSYILYQYHQCHVTQPLLLEQLKEFGISISSGEINNILTEDKDIFHKEKDSLLPAGILNSLYAQTDDTGARHNGKNGVCTVIGNELFAWFQSTQSKSRINFLELLRGEAKDYVLNADALDYIEAQKISRAALLALTQGQGHTSESRESWEQYLISIGITGEEHIRIATEGALLGSMTSHGFPRGLIILSDDAGQYEIKTLRHALCWIHVERLIRGIPTVNDDQRADVKVVRDQIWNYYRCLKLYCSECIKGRKDLLVWKDDLDRRFDAIFKDKDCYFATLNQALGRIYKNKKELLVALDHPEVPLHNNGSERDIREYVKRRKVSGSTRSDLGRQGRDTFTSLKKTCRKLTTSFWEYLNDRVNQTGKIPNLSQLILNKATVPG